MRRMVVGQNRKQIRAHFIIRIVNDNSFHNSLRLASRLEPDTIGEASVKLISSEFVEDDRKPTGKRSQWGQASLQGSAAVVLPLPAAVAS